MFLACLLIVTTWAADWENTLSEGSLQGFLTPSEVETFITSLNNNIEVKEIATTSQNNTVLAYVHRSDVSSFSSIIVSAGHTTLQPLSVTMSLYYFASILTATEDHDNYELYKFIRENFDLYVLPMVNFDAYAQMEAQGELQYIIKNLRPGCNDTTKTGVDLNRNFGKEFSKDLEDQCSDYYQGTSAYSEPETAGIKSLAEKTDFILWVHYDGYGNNYYIPWTYDTTQKDYGSISLNISYDNITQTLEYENVTIKASDNIIKGSLIDYALSLKSVSIQPAIGVKTPDKEDILTICSEHMGYSNEILKLFAQNPVLEYIQGTLSDSVLNSDNVTYSTEGLLNFTITNPSYSEINILLNISILNLQSNFTFYSKSTRDEEEILPVPIKIEKMMTQVYTIYFTIVHYTQSFNSFEALAYVYSKSGYLSSDFIDLEVPSSDDNNDFNFLTTRSWYRSSSHHEGVAIGLVSALIATILALVILLLFCLYKKEPGTEEEESEPGFIHKEIHVAKNNEDQHVNIRQPIVKVPPPKAQDSSSGSFNFQAKEEAPDNKFQPLAKIPQPKTVVKSQFSNDDEPRIIAMPSEKHKFSIKEEDDDDIKPAPIVNIPNRPNANIPKAVEVPEHHKPHFKEDYPQGTSYPIIVSKPNDTNPIVKAPPGVYKAPEMPVKKLNEPQGEIIKVQSKPEIKEKFISPPIISSKGRVEFKSSDSDSSGIEILHNPTNVPRPAPKIMMQQDFDEDIEIKKVTQPTPGQALRPYPVDTYQGHLAVPIQGHKNEGSATFQPPPNKESQGIYSSPYKYGNDSKSNSSKASKGSSSRKNSSSSSSSSSNQ